MKPIALEILQHTLGANEFGVRTGSRNYFCTDPKCGDGQVIAELISLGFMRDLGPQRLAGGMHYFHATPEGIEAMKAASPKPPKVSRSRARYLRYLESEPSCSFGEWLKMGGGRE